jgi:hypothetical protein
MNSFTLTSPVALLVFNRPAETERVFAAIREARPTRLFIVADGPRANRSDDISRCAEVRRIVENVNWPCEVLHNYSDTNLGCRDRVSSGIDWVFGQVEDAIILEDDCLPDPSFFSFSQEMLDKYRNDNRIASIGGSNYQFGSLNISHSYYFSIYNHIWGWASWKRAWKDYDVHMLKWPTVRDTDWLASVFHKKIDAFFWKANFEKVFVNELDTWDLQWTFANWFNNRLSIIPRVNLVSNIGFGSDATHTKNCKCQIANMRKESMDFPIIHPDDVLRNSIADAFTQENLFRQGYAKTLLNSLKYFMLRYR